MKNILFVILSTLVLYSCNDKESSNKDVKENTTKQSLAEKEKIETINKYKKEIASFAKAASDIYDAATIDYKNGLAPKEVEKKYKSSMVETRDGINNAVGYLEALVMTNKITKTEYQQLLQEININMKDVRIKSFTLKKAGIKL